MTPMEPKTQPIKMPTGFTGVGLAVTSTGSLQSTRVRQIILVLTGDNSKAIQGSQGQTEAKIKIHKIKPIGGCVIPYPYEPTRLITSCNKNQSLTGGLLRGFKNKNTNNSKIQIQIQNKKNSKSKNPKFHSYFAVFFEGAGPIWLPNVNGNNKHNPRFCITFSLKK